MDDFIYQMLSESGFDWPADAAVMKQLVQDLADEATSLINRRVLDAMCEQDAMSLEKLIDQAPDDPGAVQRLIARSVPNAADISAHALLEFRGRYIRSSATS